MSVKNLWDIYVYMCIHICIYTHIRIHRQTGLTTLELIAIISLC